MVIFFIFNPFYFLMKLLMFRCLNFTGYSGFNKRNFKGPSLPDLLPAALGNLGQINEAREVVEEAVRIKPDLSLSYIKRTLPTKQPGGLQPYLDGLGKAGLRE